jgi:hypothetical protein
VKEREWWTKGKLGLRALVVNSPKFSQILAKKCTLVSLATHFSKTSNIKLSKYSLLQINTIFLLVLKQPLPTTFNYHETKFLWLLRRLRKGKENNRIEKIKLL